MTNYPNGYDDDSTLPPVNDNIDQIGGDAINALRDAVVAIEMALGTNIAGVQPNLAARLGVFINPDGTPNASIIYGLGLVTLPIYDDAIASTAGIQESKLKLDYRTQDLFNYIRDLAKDVNLAIGWISVSGIKLEPHLIGAIYRHDLAQIDVAEVSSQFLNNVFRVLRDNTDAYTLINDMNNELLAHQWADGSPFGVIKDIITNDGSTYPSNYAHVASGVFLDTTGFAVIPQTAINEQLAWDFLDQASILTLGTRIQNLYANGISVNSRSSSLTTDGYGQPLVPPTPAIAYLRDTGSASFPFDDIAMGDDIVQFFPSPDDGYTFDEQFALVRVGDIVRVNYANDGYFVEVPYVISEKKYFPGNPATNSTFIVRIAGKNIAYSPNAVARIDKTLFNNNKKGVLAVSGVNSTNLPLNTTPSLVVANPRGAQCIGVGFSPDEFNETHYFLYLALYPTGNPLDGYQILPAIDVTGNAGTTPGSYTLAGIVNATNQNFRRAGFNYRFVAFDYEGEFGIMLADSYNNASFSVMNGIVTSGGFYSQSLSELNFPNNVIDLFPSGQTVTTGATITLPVSIIAVASTAGFNSSGTLSVTTSGNGIQAVTYTSIVGNTFTGCSGGTGSVPAGSQVSETLLGITAPDPLGFGPFGAGVSSPPFMGSTGYGTFASAIVPTVIWPPLRRNNYYVNGTEQEKLTDYVNDGQVQDQYGDGYWVATVQGVSPGVSNVSVTYLIPLDLSTSGLKAGKTLVVQPIDGYNFGSVDYGRFIISNITFTCCPPVQTEITVYDAVHGVGGSPYPVLSIGSTVGIYFNNDSVSFNNETATDFSVVNAPFKRHFEVYVDSNGDTFTHERARFNPSGASGSSILINAGFGAPLYGNASFATMDIYSVSPTLRGYQFGNVNKINLNITSYSGTTGDYSGYLCQFDGTNFLSQGPVANGKIGRVTRFYDQSHNDYIELIFQFIQPPPNFTNQYIDIQLFPTLSLDQEVMLLGTVEVNGTSVSEFQDLREFGNTSEQQLTTSALNYIALPEQLLHFNGVIRGFGFLNNDGGPTPPNQYGSAGLMSLNGGVALVNGNFQYINPEIFLVPAVQEFYLSVFYPINYALCVNSDGELVTIVLTDYDPVLGTPNAPERIATVLNAVSSTIYQVESCTFSELLNTRKNLTPLYIVSAVVSGAGTTAATTLTNIRDVRRFITDSDSESPAVLTDSGQGNFKTLAAALNWLKFNSEYQDVLQVKGTFTETGDPVTVDPGLNFPLTIEAGGSTAALTFPPAMVMSDVTFDGMTLTFSSMLTATNCTFNNCTVTFVGGAALNSVTFNDCSITFESTSTLTNVTIDPSTVNVGATLSVSNLTANNCTFNVTVVQGFALGLNVDFTTSTFNYTVNPVGFGSYSTTNLVNASNGMMYANVTTSLSGFNVVGCTFNNSLPDHFPFISLQIGGTNSYSAIVTGANISGNIFNGVTGNNDKRAVISIVSTILTAPPGGTFPAIPKLVNVSITNNICNFDQIILLSATRTAGQPITGACLACTNCRIVDNVCGVVGYFTAADFTANNNDADPTSAGQIRDKTDQLAIARNTCKIITNLDSVGQYIAFKATETDGHDWVKVGTGACTISQNAANWILVGAAAWTAAGTEVVANADGVIISNNTVSPGNIAFLNPYQDVNNSNIIPPNTGILLRSGSSVNTDYNLHQSVISANNLNERILLELGGVYSQYWYSIGIKCESSATITGNAINSVVSGSSTSVILLGGSIGPLNGPTISCTGNMLTRGAYTVGAYIQSTNSGSTNNVTITDNIFDSTYLDSANTVWNDLIPTAMPTVWAYHNNKNQVGYTSAPVWEYFSGGGNPSNIGSFFGSYNDYSTLMSSYQTAEGTGGAGFFSWYIAARFRDFIPDGVQVLYAAMGITNYVNQLGSLAPSAISGAGVGLRASNSMSNVIAPPSLPGSPPFNATNTPALTNSILDVFNIGTSSTYTFAPSSAFLLLDNTGQGTTNVNNIQNESFYLLMDFNAASQPFVTGREYDPTIALVFTSVAWSGGPGQIILSPIVVRYVWS